MYPSNKTSYIHYMLIFPVRTMLEAIISFLPTPGEGAIGALDWTKAERQALAKDSHSFKCDTCGAISELIETPEGDAESLPTEQLADLRSQIEQISMVAGSDNSSGSGSASGSLNSGSSGTGTGAGTSAGSSNGTPAAAAQDQTAPTSAGTEVVMSAASVAPAAAPSIVAPSPPAASSASSATPTRPGSRPGSAPTTPAADSTPPAAPAPVAPVPPPPAAAKTDYIDTLLGIAMAIVASLIALLVTRRYLPDLV